MSSDLDPSSTADQSRWNARYGSDVPTFEPHPLVAEALAAGLLAGPVLELACGRSGSALMLAEAGRSVVAVDISDLAIGQLRAEADRRDLAHRIDCVVADVPSFVTERGRFAFVLATLYWDPVAFASACDAVLPGALVGWEALATQEGGRGRYRVKHGELSARLPAGFEVIAEEAHVSGEHHTTRLLARRRANGP